MLYFLIVTVQVDTTLQEVLVFSALIHSAMFATLQENVLPVKLTQEMLPAVHAKSDTIRLAQLALSVLEISVKSVMPQETALHVRTTLEQLLPVHVKADITRM